MDPGDAGEARAGSHSAADPPKGLPHDQGAQQDTGFRASKSWLEKFLIGTTTYSKIIGIVGNLINLWLSRAACCLFFSSP